MLVGLCVLSLPSLPLSLCVQNRVGELHSLLRFLELDPYAYYFCRKKGCDCKSLHWRFGPKQKACESCGCPSPYHFSCFNRTILNPITRYVHGLFSPLSLSTLLFFAVRR